MIPLDLLHLYEYPLSLRLVILVSLISIGVWCTRRGLQYGILLGLASGMVKFVIFTGEGPLPDLSIDRAIWLIVLAVFFHKWRRGEINRLPLDGIEWCIIGFVIILLSSAIIHSGASSDQGWALDQVVRGYAVPFMAYFIARRGIQSTRQIHTFFVGMGFILIYLVGTGLAEIGQMYWLVFPSFITDPEIGSHFGQARGIFTNASYLGLAIAMTLPFLIWLYCTDRMPRRWLWPVIAALAVIPLAYTIQRAAWLSAVIAIGITILAWPRRRVLLTGILLFAAACGALGASEVLIRDMQDKIATKSSLDWRLLQIESGWDMFQDNVLFGVGLNRYRFEFEDYKLKRSETGRDDAHNTWITALAEFGLVGALPYFGIFGCALWACVTLYWRYPPYRVILGILLGVTLGYLMMSISVELRGSLYHTCLLFALWGMIFQAVRRCSIIERDRRSSFVAQHVPPVLSVQER